MKTKMLTIAAVIVGALTATSLTSAPAVARDRFAFSFDTGNVRFGYADGYYDHYGNWHRWGSRRDAAAFRMQYRDRYWDRGRGYYPNRGWRDNDGDGVPNRFDARPNNPYRD